jgi:hypothetical protein
MWAALTAFFRAVTVLARIYAARQSFDLQNEIRLQNERDENEIEKLRAAAAQGICANSNSLAADRLQQHIDRRSLIPFDLSAASFEPGRRDAGAYNGGDVHPAKG